jgi:D-glycero-D-manno-heptose 1,7-bisphosphate phosphatase
MKERALFLDRDGVVNVDSGYTHRQDQFAFIPGIFELVAEATRRGYKTFIVTNQAGIGRGYYTEQDFWTLMDWVTEKFAEAGGSIQRTYFCPHHPEHGVGPYHQECACRKPAPGMLLQAAHDYDIDLGHSVFLGDKKTDMAAGRAAGVGALLYMGDEPDYQPAIKIASPLDAIAYLRLDER